MFGDDMSQKEMTLTKQLVERLDDRQKNGAANRK